MKTQKDIDEIWNKVDALEKRLKEKEEELENLILEYRNKEFNTNNVNQHINFESLRESYFKECVDKTNGKGKLYICLAPHDLFEWFRKEIMDISINHK
jgi:hypothetical protein